MDSNLPGSSVHGMLQARILEWVAMPSSRGASQPKDQTQVFCIGRQILYCLSHQGRPVWLYTVYVIQSFLDEYLGGCSFLTFNNNIAVNTSLYLRHFVSVFLYG